MKKKDKQDFKKSEKIVFMNTHFCIFREKIDLTRTQSPIIVSQDFHFLSKKSIYFHS